MLQPGGKRKKGISIQLFKSCYTNDQKLKWIKSYYFTLKIWFLIEHCSIARYYGFSFYLFSKTMKLFVVVVVSSSYYAKLKRDEEERQKELESKYRDRVSFEML